MKKSKKQFYQFTSQFTFYAAIKNEDDDDFLFFLLLICENQIEM
jgi:hypothetical protein